MAESIPYWRLIAVLRASLPLAPALAMRLYEAAVGLHRRDEGVEKLSGDLAMGVVRRLGGDAAMGSITGPEFEAEIDTPEGSGLVRFILTREGLEEDSDSDGDHAGDRRAPGAN